MLRDGHIECSLKNLSLRGAQIIVDASSALPNRFALSLVPDARNPKICEVIWRRGDAMGLKFVDWPDRRMAANNSFWSAMFPDGRHRKEDRGFHGHTGVGIPYDDSRIARLRGKTFQDLGSPFDLT
jgi:hypothetical protein